MNADTVTETFTDSGIHINETGHAIIARALEPWVKTLIPL
jgi:lysophospholipase L1-like esterase